MLLIFSCILGGFLINQEYMSNKLQKYTAVVSVISSLETLLGKFKSYIGIACVVIGLWSFFSPYYSSSVDTMLGRQDFIGDLFPAVFSFIVGIMLSVDILQYVNLSADPDKSMERKNKIIGELEKQKVLIGFLSIFFGVMHIFDYIGGGFPFI